MKRLSLLLAVVLAMAVSACSDENKYSRKFPCSFVFHTQYHPTSQLTLCLSNPGEFVIVSATVKQGVTHLLITPNSGAQQEDIAMATAIENERTSYQNMGANRSLIVGMSHFDGLKAYDRQCPNCLEQVGGINYPLSFIKNGQEVSCARCNRTYSLMAEGMPSENGQQGDRALLQYMVSHDGTRLYIHN
jgi:hypothetical protein